MGISRNFILPISALLTIGMLNECRAYSTETHALITKQAYSRSVLGTGSMSSSLGLNRLDNSGPFNLYWQQFSVDQVPSYYTQGPSSLVMFPEDFEQCQMQEFLNLRTPVPFQIFGDTVSLPGISSKTDIFLPIANWLVRGAIREDDVRYFSLGPSDAHCGREFMASGQGSSVRSLKHFYDPYSNTGLLANQPSVNWALGYIDSFSAAPQLDTNRGNFFSYADARIMFWNSLTWEAPKQSGQVYGATQRESDATVRLHSWATTVRALGDVVHLLEDVGQPQHARNDAHAAVNSLEKQAFEDYTNDRVLGVTDESNSYVRGFFGAIKTPFAPPPLGSYPVPMFSTPVRFFTTRGDGGAQAVRAGLADYSNRGFFTGGTLPETTSEPLPTHPLDTSYGIVITPCEGLADADSRLQSVTCAHYTHSVPDVVATNYSDLLPTGFTQPPLVSDSVFKEIVAVLGGGTQQQLIPQTAIGIAELDTMGNMTIPRAVGYATGMLNFFFRGQLTLSAPPDGLYAVIDQGTPHTVSGDGIPLQQDGVTTFGFTTIRVRVKNTTMVDSNGNPTLVDAGFKSTVAQTMGAGTGPDGQPNGYLVAIARYHRNPCYKPDLTGEYISIFNADGTITNTIPDGCTTAQTRTAYQEISVSAPIQLDNAGNLPGPGGSTSACANVGNINTGATQTGCANNSALLEFNFTNDPIPINATDLFLQVAYRGRLGDETDGVAIGMMDIGEPTYTSLINSSDWAYTNGNWTPVDTANQLTLGQIKFCLNAQAIVANQTLQPREFMRIAFLTDLTDKTKGLNFEIPGYLVQWTAPFGYSPRQSDLENGGTFVNYAWDSFYEIMRGMSYTRGVTEGEGSFQIFNFSDPYPPDTIADRGIKEHMQPSLGGSGGVGVPNVAQPITFTSAPDSDCSQLMSSSGASASAKSASSIVLPSTPSNSSRVTIRRTDK